MQKQSDERNRSKKDKLLNEYSNRKGNQVLVSTFSFKTNVWLRRKSKVHKTRVEIFGYIFVRNVVNAVNIVRNVVIEVNVAKKNHGISPHFLQKFTAIVSNVHLISQKI